MELTSLGLLLLSVASSYAFKASAYRPSEARLLRPIDHTLEETIIEDEWERETVDIPVAEGRRLVYNASNFQYRFERIFNFISGDWEFRERRETAEEPFTGPHQLFARHYANHSANIGRPQDLWEGPHGPRTKRQAFPQTENDLKKIPQLLQLAVYIDEDMYQLYRTKYKELAEDKIRTFVGVMLNTTRSLYQHRTLEPRLDISVEKVEIWKRQPRSLRSPRSADDSNGLRYVEEFCNYVRPRSRGFDHATLISGKRLQVGLDIDGIAWQDSVCSDASCTVVRGAFNTAYRHGNTLAHEMGHSLGMAHDGSGKSAACDEFCCIMAPKQTGTEWSRCSAQQYRRTLLDPRTPRCTQHNRASLRLTQLLANGPMRQMPGQVLPDEAQCHQIVGTCYRSVPGHEGDCEKHYCTRHTDSTIMTTISEFRLDGSYCGAGRVCEGGQCRLLSNSRLSQMRAVDGGWSSWQETSEPSCGGGTCSDCVIKDQTSLKVVVRRCDKPYPLNGGRPCRGSQIRGVRCTGSKAGPRCRSSSRRRSSRSRSSRWRTSYIVSGRMQYMEAVCKRQFRNSRGESLPKTGVIYRKDGSSCDFMCYNKERGVEVPKRFPDGTECDRAGGRSGAKGVCVHGVCMYPDCRNNNDFFVVSRRDCP